MNNEEILGLLEMIMPTGSLTFETAKEWGEEIIRLRRKSKNAFWWGMICASIFIATTTIIGVYFN